MALLDFHTSNFMLVRLYTTRTEHQNRTDRTGQAEQHSQNRTGRTGQAEQDSQNRTARTGLPEWDRHNNTALTGQPGHESQDTTGRDKTGRKMTCRTGKEEPHGQTE